MNKKSYQSPKLFDYGDLISLTKSTTGPGAPDALGTPFETGGPAFDDSQKSDFSPNSGGDDSRGGRN